MRKSIEQDTVLLPFVVADTVVRELGSYLGWEYPLDDSVQDFLAHKAEHIYQKNEMFANRLHRVAGREFLYSFMRHWLSAWVKDNLGAAMFDRIPHGYRVGRDLPGVTA